MLLCRKKNKENDDDDDDDDNNNNNNKVEFRVSKLQTDPFLLPFNFYLFELIFALLTTFRGTGERILAGLFLRSKSSVVCPKFPMGSKFNLSQSKTYFSQFIDKFLKLEEMEYLIHVKFKMWLALCKSSILFSTVNLKLEQNFSQYINRCKIGTLQPQP